MKVLYYENIFSDKFKQQVIEEEKISIEDLVKKIGNENACYIIIDKDLTYGYPENKDVILESENIEIKLVPQGKKNIISAVLVVAGTILCFTPAAPLGASLIASGVAGFVAGLLMKTPNNPDYSSEEQQVKYGVSGTSNKSNLGSIYPVVFGESILTPPYVGKYYTNLSDNTGDGEQYLTVLLNCGYAPLSLKNFKIGTNLIATNRADVRNGNVALDGEYNAIIEIRQDGTLPSIYNKKYNQEQIGSEIKTLQNNERDVRTSPKKTKAIRFDIKFNALYHQNKENGSLEKTTVNIRFAYRKTGTQEWKDISSTVKHEIYQTVISNITIYQQTATGYTFNVSSSSGTLEGKYEDDSIKVKINNTWKNVSGATSLGVNYTAGENKTKRWYVNLNFTNEELANNPDMQWDITAWRTTADRDQYFQDKALFESVLYTIDDVPVIASERAKLCLVAFRIQANEYIQNVIDKVNVEATSVLPTWNGNDWSIEVPSSNPASCYLKAITGEYLKKKADNSQIDWETFQKLYEFCEDKGYECNGVISNSETLKSIIAKILNTCRTEFTIKNGMYSAIIDDVRPSPVAIISPKNSSKFQFTKDLSKKVNAIKCTYQNKDDDYKTTEEEIRLNGESPAIDDNIVSANLWGVNNHEQAVKLCRYNLACARLRPETYTCRVGIEHFSLPRGSRVELSHDVLMIGIKRGYIRKVEGNKITLDELLPIQEDGKTYGIKIVPQTGDDIQVYQVRHFDGSVYEIETTTNLNGIQEGDFYAYGESGKITEDCIIVDKEIEDAPDLGATLTLKAYAPEIFNAETQPIPEYDSKITSSSKFSTDFVYEGSVEDVDIETNGSTVQDNGAIFLNVKSNYIGTGNIINLGDLYTIGQITYTCSLESYSNRTWLKGGSGYARFKVDNALYENYSICGLIKAVATTSRSIIAYYNDFRSASDRNTIILYSQDNKMFLDIDGIEQEIDWDFDYPHNVVIVNNRITSIVSVYIDGSISVSINTAIFEANLIAENGDNLILDSFSPQNNSNDRNKYFYLFQDYDGGYKSQSLVAEFRIFKFALKEAEVKNLYLNNYYLQNTIAESKYLGEFDVIPPDANIYDWFYYTGSTNVNFLQNHYYRKNRDGWQLYEIYLASININV